MMFAWFHSFICDVDERGTFIANSLLFSSNMFFSVSGNEKPFLVMLSQKSLEVKHYEA